MLPFLIVGYRLKRANSMNQLKLDAFAKAYGVLYMRYNYEHSYYAWELVVMARKLAFVMVSGWPLARNRHFGQHQFSFICALLALQEAEGRERGRRRRGKPGRPGQPV